jgi:hypothetical protein
VLRGLLSPLKRNYCLRIEKGKRDGISIKALKRRVTVVAGVAVVMIVASVPAFSQYRYERDRSVNRRGSILGQIFRREGVRRRPVVYGRSNEYYRYNNNYYRGNTHWRGRFYGFNNYYRNDRHRWQGRSVGHYRSAGRGYRNW